MSSIATQLESYKTALAEATTRGDQAVARKIQEQIKDLEEFQIRHPEESEAPTPFEVFCDLNPSDVNCLVYDD
ncbi:MAG: CP12 domain-containing protein [Cyanobium sp.]